MAGRAPSFLRRLMRQIAPRTNRYIDRVNHYPNKRFRTYSAGGDPTREALTVMTESTVHHPSNKRHASNFIATLTEASNLVQLSC